MNATAQQYLNLNDQDHREAFNAYIKDCLITSKPLELNMSDFISEQLAKPYRASQKAKTDPLHQAIRNEIDKNKRNYPDSQNGILRLSLLQSFVMSMMMNASTKEQSNAIYAAFQFITDSTPV